MDFSEAITRLNEEYGSQPYAVVLGNMADWVKGQIRHTVLQSGLVVAPLEDDIFLYFTPTPLGCCTVLERDASTTTITREEQEELFAWFSGTWR